jgi:hypothetical protein
MLSAVKSQGKERDGLMVGFEQSNGILLKPSARKGFKLRCCSGDLFGFSFD